MHAVLTLDLELYRLQKQRRFGVINIPPKNGAAPPTPSTSTNNVDVTPTVSVSSINVPVLDDDSLLVSVIIVHLDWY